MLPLNNSNRPPPIILECEIIEIVLNCQDWDAIRLSVDHGYPSIVLFNMKISVELFISYTYDMYTVIV